MNAYCLTLNDTNIVIEKKDIKHLHISVCPPDGSVRVSCPLALNDESIRLSLIKRLPWIKEQQQNFLNQNRQSKRGMLERESHYLFGKHYLLKIEHTTKKHFVLQSPKYLILHVHCPSKNKLKKVLKSVRKLLQTSFKRKNTNLHQPV
ncbi:YgjP-like metallopeptidase domain-containing protein [Helicobacter pylori]|uniref:YgjP-like metallopeptidase domain-containing protein n=1 Tax=Helicobacter pylori TaxID=210 RepID=UPI001EE85BE7|nr:YgjP-like metallopeptidase domain-containing protein [Helicobacter pylori]